MHSIRKIALSLGGSLLLVAGISLLSFQMMLMWWRNYGGEQHDIQARGPILAGVLMLSVVYLIGIVSAIVAAIAAVTRRRSMLPISAALAVVSVGMYGFMITSGPWIVFAPAIALQPIIGQAAAGIVACGEVLVGLALLCTVVGYPLKDS